MLDSLAIAIGEMSVARIASESSAGGDSPTVFTLVLDDLLTRHYPGTDQRFKLTATAGTTGFIEIDDDALNYNDGDVNIQAEFDTKFGGSVATIGVVGGSSLADGSVSITWINNGDVADSFALPNGASLTAPEITHSIS